MLISCRWLERHVDLSGLSPETLAGDLTLRTAEVEGLERVWPHADEVVVGHVVSRRPHPGADRLSKCEVDVGEGELRPIVCGAANVAAGQKVPVALPGVNIPGIGKLKKSKIRGEVSLGMICSEQEMGLADKSEGIWVLPEESSVGAPLSEAMGLVDWVIDIDNKSLTHRPDLWGHRGIARELSAIFQRPLRPLSPELPSVAAGETAGPAVSLRSEACLRYLALPIQGVAAAASPLWLRRLLVAVGQRSRGQLVDVSNFVMLDLGQPNHVFDARRLEAGVTVRAAQAGEAFTALDGTELKLTPADLVIATGPKGERAAALAGVIGGQATEVQGDTQEVVLEVATFNAATVRRTSARHGVRTDSSARFEKTLDPQLPPLAAAHFVSLLSELQPALKLAGPPVDVRRFEQSSTQLQLRPSRVRSALGAPLSDEQIAELLERLGFVVSREPGAAPSMAQPPSEAPSDAGAGRWLVQVPSDRATKDVTQERDLVEEVGRLYGYGNIEERALLAPVVPPPYQERRRVVRAVQDRLSGSAAFSEVLNYSFQPDSLLESLGLLSQDYCELDNPVAAGEGRMRRSLVPSLLAGIEALRRAREDVRLYEVGKGYVPASTSEPEERHLVALLWAGTAPAAEVGFRQTRFFRLYGVAVDLLRALERPAPDWAPNPDPPPWAHPAKALVARFADGREVGQLCALRPDTSAALGLRDQLRSEVVVCELSLDAVLSEPRQPRRYVPAPRFPGIKVDVAVAAPSALAASDVHAAIVKAGGNHCQDAELFDVYHGEALGTGRKSLAFHIFLQSDAKTLSDNDERKFLKKLELNLQAIGAELRNG